MHHSTSCENAKGTQCRCTCGGASHNRSVIASITGDHRKAREWATSRRWDQKSSDGQPSGTKPAARGRSTVQAVIAESLIYLLDEGIPADESAALKTLAEAMSDEIGAEITAELATCAEQDRPKHHFWCVVLAAVCKTYDLWIRRVRTDLDAAIDIVVDAVFEIVVAESSSRPNLGKNNTAMRAIGGVSQQKHLAFADDLYRSVAPNLEEGDGRNRQRHRSDQRAPCHEVASPDRGARLSRPWRTPCRGHLLHLAAHPRPIQKCSLRRPPKLAIGRHPCPRPQNAGCSPIVHVWTSHTCADNRIMTSSSPHGSHPQKGSKRHAQLRDEPPRLRPLGSMTPKTGPRCRSSLSYARSQAAGPPSRSP